MEQIRISAKTLGQLALPDFCPRCFWLKMRLNNRLPWSMFPGIFASIDSYSKKVTNVHWEVHDTVPPWLGGFGDLARPITCPHHSNFHVIDKNTDVRLSGVPDEILRTGEGLLWIIDYKTARFTPHQDLLLPMYHVQLNAYAYIARRKGFDPVEGLGLVYYEPRTDLPEEDLPQVLLPDGFAMRFRANLHPLKLEAEEMIPPLLRKARAIVDPDRPPEGLGGCKDCKRVDQLIDLLG